MGLDIKQFMKNKSEISKEEMDEALNLLAKKKLHDAKVKSGEIKGSSSGKWADKSPEAKAASKEYNKKRTAKMNLLAKKAMEAGLKVSDEEVAKAMAATK